MNERNQAALREDTEKRARLYVAIELSRKKWKLGISDGTTTRARVVSVEAQDWKKLKEEVEKARERLGMEKDAPVRSCYEAGREGFWIHRALVERMGIENIVVDAASIDVKRRKRAKTDRIDAEQLVRHLIRYWRGERDVWSVVRVPSEEAEDSRQMHREMEVLKRERGQHRTRIQSLLFTVGLDVEVTTGLMKQLDQLCEWSGKPLPEGMKERIRREYARMKVAEADLAGLKKQQRKTLQSKQSSTSLEKIRKLKQLRGIAAGSSWVFVMELFGWRRFRNRREVAGALGITPMPYQSGDSAREQGISHAGNRRARTMAIEIAWSWLRYQPKSRLSRWYRERFGSGGPRMRRIGIVAMARKLMVDLWRYVELGTLPEGAQLKAAA
ncbi:MAG TPA: IS110 family transposase [Terriglobia bacterium]|nr:IS110 family transposase [Terriglobia bacterium]